MKEWNIYEIRREVVTMAADALESMAKGFFFEIKTRWPVGNPALWKRPYAPKGYVGGYSKSMWSIEKLDSLTWEVSNPVVYTPVLWRGRIFDGKQWRGSTQMPAGGDPILEKYVEGFKV